MRTLKKVAMSVATAATIIVSGGEAQAQSAQLEDLIYYDIGGASAYNRPIGFSNYDILDLSANASISLSCGEFDLEANLDELINEFENLGDNIANLVEAFAANIVSNLPLLVLREVNPNLANLVENTTARYEELYRIAIADCQEMQRSILQEDNPYAGWVRVIRKEGWEQSIEDGETATTAQETADQGAPVVWIGGVEAGQNSNINIVQDLVTFGYGQLSGGLSPIGEIWASPGEAARYATEVLGEMTINIEGGSSSIGGAGVLPQVQTTYEESLLTITDLTTKENATSEELALASSSYIRLTASVMDALRNQAIGARRTYTARLASEIATAKEAEKLLALRRILLTARREPHVVNTPAWEHVNDFLIPELNQEIDYLLQQQEIAKTMVSETSRILIRSMELKEQQADSFLGSPNNQDTTEGFKKK